MGTKNGLLTWEECDIIGGVFVFLFGFRAFAE